LGRKECVYVVDENPGRKRATRKIKISWVINITSDLVEIGWGVV
jgi:hypothetical protein